MIGCHIADVVCHETRLIVKSTAANTIARRRERLSEVGSLRNEGITPTQTLPHRGPIEGEGSCEGFGFRPATISHVIVR